MFNGRKAGDKNPAISETCRLYEALKNVVSLFLLTYHPSRAENILT